MFFAAVGSNILIGPNPSCDEASTLVYDTHTSGLAVGPPLPGSLLGDFHLTFAVPGADNDTGAEPEIWNTGVKATYNTSLQQFLMVSFFAYEL
jgi:hypothetical protein